MVPQPLGAETIEQRIARYQETLATVVPRIGELWTKESLPSILPGLDKAKNLDYASMADAQLLAALDELASDFVARYVVHGRINFVTVAASWFADFYNEALKPADSTEPYEALQGFPTRSVDAGRGMWRLSRVVRNSASLLKAFEEVDTRELVSHLEASEEGQRFLAEFRSYLEEFGWRSDAFEMADASWRENPVIPLNAIQGYIRLGNEGDPELQHQAAIARREQLLARARERLAVEPEKLARFNQLYDAAKHYLNVTEDHNFYIDQVGHAVMRLPVLEIGRRLAAKDTVAEPNDVFLLYRAEIREAMTGKRFKETIRTRRAEMEKWAKVLPPPVLGEPPLQNADPFGEAMAKMFGMPPEPSQDPAVIKGIAASPGSIQARAKVVRNLSEASKIEPGDVLVCEMTMPPWTPLFATVSAVIADTGGVLSHCAIVAREYRIPCVVGTIVGTSLIKDGMTVTVDGTKGFVRIESQAH